MESSRTLGRKQLSRGRFQFSKLTFRCSEHPQAGERANSHEPSVVFISPKSMPISKDRLMLRGTETEQEIDLRIENAGVKGAENCANVS